MNWWPQSLESKKSCTPKSKQSEVDELADKLEHCLIVGDLDPICHQLINSTVELSPRLRVLCSRALRYAVNHGNPQQVRMLLTKNPDLNFGPDSKLLSPLWNAVLYEYSEIAELLVRAGADVNERLGPHSIHDQRSTFLHMLASSRTDGFSDCLFDLMIRYGANVNAVDSKGNTVLHYAATLGKVDMVQRLLIARARVNVVNILGETVLHAAAQSRAADQLVPMLIRYRAKFLAVDRRQMNALHYLARASREGIKAAKQLMELGVSVDAKETAHGYTPLHYAVMSGKEELTYFLIGAGADIDARSRTGFFPLYFAAKLKTSKVIHLLIKHKVNLHAKNYRGRTAMHAACSSVKPNNIQELLRFGGDINIKDDEGNTPFSLIEYKNLNPAMETVIKHFAMFGTSTICKEDSDIIDEYPKLKSFYESCLSEVKKLEETKFYDNFSCICMFEKKQSALVSLFRNMDFETEFKVCLKKNVFPIYGAEIERRFSNVWRRKELLVNTETRLETIFYKHFPNGVIRLIARMLNDDESTYLDNFNIR